MAEALSPKAKQRAPFSPTSPFFLASNNDKLERAQARAARAAAVRRKLDAPTSTTPEDDPCLGKEQILQLLHNCIKLASENVRICFTVSVVASVLSVFVYNLFVLHIYLNTCVRSEN